MKIVFFGTPDYVVPILEALYKAFKLRSGESPTVAVVTQAPKPVGRKQIMEYSPVDNWGHKKKILVLFKSADLIKKQIKADLGVLASYGEIIPNDVISLFPYGILNIHPSLLPNWRGASPIQATIISGEKQTGVSIIKLDPELDHGPILSQFKDEVLESDTTDSLRRRLFSRSAEVLPKLIEAYIEGKIIPKRQDDELATYTYQIKKEDAFIPPEFLTHTLTGTTLVTSKWNIPFIKNYYLMPSSLSLERFIRAMQPWPGCWTNVQLNSKLKTKNLKRLKILKAHLEKTNKPVPNAYCLVPDFVQLEGKSPVFWKQFCQGYPEAKFIK
jgi:methionyl-tRNA formyltransferase